MMGDLNGDGLVNVVDVVLLINGILGKTVLTAAQIGVGDMNGDGKLNVLDVVRLVKLIVGK